MVPNLVHGEAALGDNLIEGDAALGILVEVLARGSYRLPVFYCQGVIIIRMDHHFEQLDACLQLPCPN